MAHTVTADDFTIKGDDLYYTGPLAEAQAFIKQDHAVSEFRNEAGIYVVLIAYGSEPTPTWDDCAEWGKGPTPEDAWRWVLAAVFGPIDDEFHPIHLPAAKEQP